MEENHTGIFKRNKSTKVVTKLYKVHKSNFALIIKICQDVQHHLVLK